jgi:hypothetical protein
MSESSGTESHWFMVNIGVSDGDIIGILYGILMDYHIYIIIYIYSINHLIVNLEVFMGMFISGG